MITITKGQRVADYPNLFVVSPSGTYNEEDLIVCAEDDTPGKPSCMFQAQLVAFGNVVYSTAEPITDAQKAEISAERAKIAEENTPDNGRIIEPDDQPVQEPEPQARPPEEPADTPEASIPPLEIEMQPEAPAPAGSMSTTTPATTTPALEETTEGLSAPVPAEPPLPIAE